MVEVAVLVILDIVAVVVAVVSVQVAVVVVAAVIDVALEASSKMSLQICCFPKCMDVHWRVLCCLIR